MSRSRSRLLATTVAALALVVYALCVLVPTAAPRAVAQAVPRAASAAPLQRAAEFPEPAGSAAEIVVSGTGEVAVTPDRIHVSLGVRSEAPTAAAAARTNAEKQRAVLAALRRAGVAAKAITTQGFNVQAKTRFDQARQEPVPTGYVVSNIVRVRIDAAEDAGPVLDAALAAGANTVGGLAFSLSAPDGPRRRALERAVAAARAEAEVVARAAGGTLGPLVHLATSGDAGLRSRSGILPDFAAATADTPIEVGDHVVRANVTTRWAFLPAP